MKFILFLAAVCMIWTSVEANDFIFSVPSCISEGLQMILQRSAYIRQYISDFVVRGVKMFGMLDEGIGFQSPHTLRKPMNAHAVSAKKEDLLTRIHFVALFSGIAAVVPVPGVDYAVDLIIIAEETYFYMEKFGVYAVTDLKTVFIKVLVDYMLIFVMKKLVMGLLRYILPIIGIFVDFVVSYILCHCILQTILHTLAEEALK